MYYSAHNHRNVQNKNCESTFCNLKLLSEYHSGYDRALICADKWIAPPSLGQMSQIYLPIGVRFWSIGNKNRQSTDRLSPLLFMCVAHQQKIALSLHC